MNSFVNVLAAVLMLAGSALALIAAVGLFRMPDAYSRIHVATKPATLAVVCTVGAAMLRVPGLSATTKLLLAVALQFWTAPVASHMIGRAAYAAGLKPAKPWAIDDLANGDGFAEPGADADPEPEAPAGDAG
ncbi:MAG: monovalent cation/H(+) antiporter subunit G [Actinomycetia bacterium]|nr:monovalent cation/H(+) antiporter subunit G [Actinomycetes bacterium]